MVSTDIGVWIAAFFTISIILTMFNCHSSIKEQLQNLPPEPVPYLLSSEESAFLDTLQHRIFLYFWHESNPANGLVNDRSAADSPCSIAAVGFGLVAWTIGVEHGWISRDQAIQRTLNCLNFFWHSEQSDKTMATGYKGFYYHFIDMSMGRRFWNCELSTIDTALLLAGILFCQAYYDGDSKQERQIRSLADSLFFRVIKLT